MKVKYQLIFNSALASFLIALPLVSVYCQSQSDGKVQRGEQGIDPELVNDMPIFPQNADKPVRPREDADDDVSGTGDDEDVGRGEGSSGDQPSKGDNTTTAESVEVIQINEEVPTIHVESTTTASHQGERSSGSDLPQNIRLKFQYQSQNIDMKLQRNYNIPPDAPVVLGANSGVSVYNDSDNKVAAFYFDTNHHASVKIEGVPDTGTNQVRRHYMGTFYIGEDLYEFQPLSQHSSNSNQRRRRRSVVDRAIRSFRQKRDATDDVIEYIVEKCDVKKADPRETSERESSILLESLHENITIQVKERPEPGQVQEKASYIVEILAVIEYRLYLKWFQISTATTSEARHVDAINQIRYYFSHVFNGVDMRYRSIIDPAYSIGTRLVGFYIAIDTAGSKFVEDNRTPGTPKGQIDAWYSLSALEQFLLAHKSTLPPFDQASLLTSENVIGLSGSRISGLAIIRGICTSVSLSVSKDLGEYSVTQTVAHELGHNLGCGHDGLDNSCSGYDQYIMAAQAGTITDQNYKNSYTFSPCSITEMRSFLSYMATSVNPTDRCLLTESNLPVIPALGEFPGQRFNPDAQCLQLFGYGSYYCGGATEDREICRSMQCFHPQLRYCYVTIEQRAYSGTTCGNQAWCMNGDCLRDSRAAVAKDWCVYGDYKGPYTNGLNCAFIRTQAPWNCYNSYYYDDCCSSCPAIRNTSKPGCEYGDKLSTCKTMPLYDCYNNTIKQQCCDRCNLDNRPNRSMVLGCEYGDHASWCSDFIRSSIDCYNQREVCCDTCSKYMTNISGCEFGDKAAWCTGVDRISCYAASQTCCQACRVIMLSKPILGCEWGDKASWCKGMPASRCYTDDRTCCETCPSLSVNISGCEYGNRQNDCDKISSTECYSPTRLNDCCQTCKYFYTGVLGCEYGDRAPWCNGYVRTAADCTGQEYVCCQSCARFATKPTTPRILTTPTTTSVITSTIRLSTQGSRSSVQGSAVILTVKSTVCATEPDWCSASHPSICYTVNQTCCRMCEKAIYNPNYPECYYGDRFSWCSDKTYSSYYCSDPAQRSSCCQTCGVVSPAGRSTTAITTPRYTMPSAFIGCVADKASYCNTVTRSDCYVLAGACCKSCSNLYTENIGCEFGDRALWCSQYILSASDCSKAGMGFYCCETCAKNFNVICSDAATWCNTIAKNQCYDDTLQAQSCCATCRRYRQGNPAGCPYGNQRSWCPSIAADGQCAQYKYMCCESCGSY